MTARRPVAMVGILAILLSVPACRTATTRPAPFPPPHLPAAVVPPMPAAPPSGNSVIRGPAGRSEIVITTTSRLAGAVHSLTWGGKEFIDSADHGRQLQSACSFDAAAAGDFWAECYNPTEAGSRADGAGRATSSRIVALAARGPELRTATRMAFWLAPGERSSGRPALNGKVLSDHVVSKRVRIGYKQWPHAIEYDVAFDVPAGEKHTLAQFEAVTGYMPEEFSRFSAFDPKTGQLVPLSDGPGEQGLPVVLSTRNGSHAMGVYSPDQPSKGYESAGYGRFRFAPERVVKWNCVFRVRDPNGIAAGRHSFRNFVVVGDLETVRGTLAGLHQSFAAK